MDEKNRFRTSEDGSFTTDSTSTGGSDSESEHTSKTQKSKRDRSRDRPSSDPVKIPEKLPSVKTKDNKLKDPKLQIDVNVFFFSFFCS